MLKSSVTDKSRQSETQGGNTGTFKAKRETVDSYYSDDDFEGGLRSQDSKGQTDADFEGGSSDALERELAKS